MANQTVTQSINFDNFAIRGLLNNETVTILTGSVLTIDSDTQWSANSASLGTLTITDGEVLIDGTRTRMLNYTMSTVLPALENYISGTVGGAKGEIIRVLGTAASGTLKLRSISGAFAPNEQFSIYNSLTSSILGTATASAADETGYLYLLATEAGTVNIARLGTFTITGSWLTLGTSSGGNNQVFALPSGVNIPIPAVWVETSPSSDIYEIWLSAGHQRWSRTGSVTIVNTTMVTDDRGKFFSQSSHPTLSSSYNNLIAFGNATTGSIPPTNCRIRIPNVIIGVTTSTQTGIPSFSTMATRWETATTNAGAISINTALLPGVYINASQPFSVNMTDVGVFGQMVISEAPTVRLVRVGLGLRGIDNFSPALNFTTNQSMYVEDCKTAMNSVSTTAYSQFNTCNNVIVTGSRYYGFGKAAAALTNLFSICSNVTMSRCYVYGGANSVASTQNMLVESHSQDDAISGSHVTTNASNAWVLSAGSTNIVFRGFTSSYSLPRSEIYSITNCSNIKIRELGSWNNRLNLWNQTNTVLNSAGNNQNIEVSRVFVTQSRVSAGSFITTTNSNTKLLLQNYWSDPNDSYNQTTLNTRARGLRFGSGTLGSTTGITTALTSVYGTHFYDFFLTDTSGGIGIHPLEETSDAFSTGSYIVTTGSAKFNSLGAVSLRTQNDEIEWTWPWYILGHTGFANQVSQSSGTGVNRLLFTYAIDSGSGIFSHFKSASVANLIAENSGITASVGFKMKIRAKCRTSNTANLLSGYILPTVSTAAAQSSSLYPLDEVDASLVLTNLVSGSEVRIYRKTDDVELSGVEDGTGSFTYDYTWSGTDIVTDIVVHAVDYEHIRYSDISLGAAGVSIPVQQRFDRNYSNP